MLPDPDTAPVRHGEELNTEALFEYLKGRMEDAEQGLAIEQFPGGHSNLTYLVRIAQREYVLRRAPLGPVPPKAHDMAREYRVLEKVHPVFPAAPKVLLLCEDISVLGSVFFLMERRRGIILRDHVPTRLAHQPDVALRVSQAFLDCLVDLHSIDIRRNELASLGRAEGFLQRQVRGWADRWRAAETETLPEMQSVIECLEDRMPLSGAPVIVHNDYKLDNVMLDPDHPERIEAVLDWEMTTVGDPLADLGLMLCYWRMGSASAVNRGADRPITEEPGWYTRDELVDRYAAKTGRNLSRIAYYEVLGVFKLAVILQQIYFRYVRGQTQDERFGVFDRRVRALVRTAAAMAQTVG